MLKMWNLKQTIPLLLKKEFTNPAVQFIHKNKDELTAIYKQIYQGYVPGANNKETIMKNLKNLSEKDKNFVSLLQSKIGSTLLESELSYGISLYTIKWYYWFDTNVYYSPDSTYQFVNYWEEYVLPIFQTTNNLGGSISEGIESLEGTGELGEDIGAVIEIFSTLFSVIGKLGCDICQDIINDFQNASYQGEGVTNHWLFGWIYVGSSIGKVSWWGA